MNRVAAVLSGIVLGLTVAGSELPAAESTPTEVRRSLIRAAEFYTRHVATHGGYVYRYSADLQKSEGEGKTTRDTVWVQPPGTPTVGLALLEAWERTGEPVLLEGATAAGECLIQGQLRSGGWTDRIEFADSDRRKFAYRVDPPAKKRQFNVSTFDDDKTQSALRFLIRLDAARKFQDAPLHEAVTFALEAILKNQFPNGGWGQGFETPPDPAKFPVQPAGYLESWPRKYPGGDYWWFYTFNDNAIADTIEMLLLAGEVYREDRYQAAALKAADFILLAQMPEPQPAWAQQYDFQMHPVWARKFEPAAISGGESQGLIRTLLDVYVETGDRKYLEPIPRALAYLKRSELPDGRLSRFYELQTNKPLYLTKTYELTYDDGDLPTHYGFQVPSRVNELQKQYDRIAGLSADKLVRQRRSRAAPKSSQPSADEVARVVEALDDRGAWVEPGRLKYHGKADPTDRIIDSATFARNLDVLSRAVAAKP